MQYPKTTGNPAAHHIAFAALPPHLQEGIQACGFFPLRIEESGALCFGLDNARSVAVKREVLARFKTVAEDYGLCVERFLFQQAVAKQVDDGYLLVCRVGQSRVPLFNMDGSVSNEMLDEERVSRRQTAPRG